MDLFNYSRRHSSAVYIGDTPLGGDNPVRIQSMANVSTMDTEAAVAQAMRMIDAGAEYVRFTAQGERQARNMGRIREELHDRGYTAPLVADIHFNAAAAAIAAREVEKVRINPGNYAPTPALMRQRFVSLLHICAENHTAIRIGVNHGSLSERMMNMYGDTPEGMVASCMEFLEICVEEDFTAVVISIKASNTVVMVKTVRLLAAEMDNRGMSFPLHLGVTEAGDGEDGRVKSAVGIGALLADGLGDTIRVSLSEDPEKELSVARTLTRYMRQREGHDRIAGLAAAGYSHRAMERRPSRSVGEIGGGHPPVVLTKDFRRDHPGVNFVHVTLEGLTDGVIRLLCGDALTVALLDGRHRNPVGEMRAAIHRLMDAGCEAPVILCRSYTEDDPEALVVKASADFGALLLDGFGDGLMMHNEGTAAVDTEHLLLGILQAARLRITRTEYISCPGCGRTLYDLQTTVARIKAVTSHLAGLRIGIMGCIVNGPGEMADADYGYIGAGQGRISLYKGKQCIRKNIPEDEAVERLVQLIKDGGDWQDCNRIVTGEI
ncbi:MAG: (E)-4-hydroxy-3-methylbut-2-enyl-diphosphate synthase [Tannerellaceae bacterium]|jgi:(E)-4-hydroxy-3-methylbut-2-enyl-diphosphate synthase|nr:(E)-4-hydroxy-3-methylbut-2-enyl-diphosphate synthase [Tannerellaceae bacterium]